MPEIDALYNISLIGNAASIQQNGILSHELAESISHGTIASAVIQQRRQSMKVPGGLPLHQYACLYINARNPMMYKRRGNCRDICVLEVSINVVDVPDAVVSDQNAASGYARFAAGRQGLTIVNKERTMAERWDEHEDQRDYFRHKSQICAEVLVPQRIEPQFIVKAHVLGAEEEGRLRAVCPTLDIAVTPRLFFA